ncbi:hypothetical protein AVEN_170979-1 [Araneus ventricosus]|uniref:Uncharacterized protein n=1 Tax=Araneus ventricosus TaxID=182803 RepID=A0A4Y2QZF5_ARAVE|nr:hypothetical protein AVEN_170979-1 [Araneus ventricosus]
MESSRSLQKFQEVDTYGCLINCQQRKELHFYLKNSTRRPKPPESGFCRTGDLRRDRAHRVKLGQIKRRISESTPFCKSNRHTRENIEPQLLRTSRQDHHTWRNLFIE